MAVALPAPPLDVPAPWRVTLLVLAALRTAFSVVAAMVAPLLWHDHFLSVVLMRPTKEVLLASGFKVRLGDIGLLPVVLAFVPLGVLGVWLFYFVGRSWAGELHDGDGMPRWTRRILPASRVTQLCGVLEQRGQGVVVLGRLAVFPSTLMAAAAGASGMSAARFMVADGIGAALSMAIVLAAGFVLGEAYEQAGPWLTGLGAVVTLGLLVAFGRWLRQEKGQGGGSA